MVKSKKEKRIKQKEYEVRDILDKRYIYKNGKNVCEYLLDWAGYKNPSWEPFEYLNNCRYLLERFENRRLIKFLRREQRRHETKAKVDNKPTIVYYLSEDDEK